MASLADTLKNHASALAELPFEPTSRLSASEVAVFDLIRSIRPSYEWTNFDRLLLTRLARWLVKSEKLNRELQNVPMTYADRFGNPTLHPAHSALNALDQKIERAMRGLQLTGPDRINGIGKDAGDRATLEHTITSRAGGQTDDDLLA
jgi:hypothetical protein